jgi:hypothetical protein
MITPNRAFRFLTSKAAQAKAWYYQGTGKPLDPDMVIIDGFCGQFERR